MASARREPDFEGFLGIVLLRREPDRVPLAELFHDFEIMLEIQGPPPGDSMDAAAAWRVAFWRDLGYDYVTEGTDIGFPSSHLEAADTAALSRGQRGWSDEGRGPITTWEQFEAYPWPEVTPAAFRNLEAVAGHLPAGMKIAAMIPGGVFENTTQLMGYTEFSYALVDKPDLVAAIVSRVGETLCAVVEQVAGFDAVGAQWLNDDLGFKGGTLASPQFLRDLIFPYYRRICQAVHRRGKPVFMHSCGRLDGIMDDLMDDVRIDARHSFEHAITPVWEAKRKWGDRLALLGGVDMDVLARGGEDAVRAYTRRCIEECLPGGGWALGSGNTIANYVPVRSFLAMLDEGRRF